MCEKRPVHTYKAPHMWCEKRQMYVCIQRDIYQKHLIYICEKRHIWVDQKRHVNLWKKTFTCL